MPGLNDVVATFRHLVSLNNLAVGFPKTSGNNSASTKIYERIISERSGGWKGSRSIHRHEPTPGATMKANAALPSFTHSKR
jgi:hypothetical protein